MRVGDLPYWLQTSTRHGPSLARTVVRTFICCIGQVRSGSWYLPKDPPEYAPKVRVDPAGFFAARSATFDSLRL